MPVKFVNFSKSRLIFNILLFLNVCKQTFHTSRAHILKIKRCFNAKSSTYYFHMKTKILADFQICISVTLIKWNHPKLTWGDLWADPVRLLLFDSLLNVFVLLNTTRFIGSLCKILHFSHDENIQFFFGGSGSSKKKTFKQLICIRN